MEGHSSSLSSGGSTIRPHHLINTCLVCNAVFLTQKKISSDQESLTRVRSLCTMLHVSFANFTDKVILESEALCSKCNKALDEFLKLQKQILGLMKMLEELRTILGRKVVDSYGATNKNRKNYHLKVKLFEVWYARQSIPISSKNFEQRFETIINSFDNTSNRNESEKVTGSSNNNNPFPDLLAVPQQEANVNTILPVDENDDNFSTVCPSPGSPIFPHFEDDDFGTGDNACATNTGESIPNDNPPVLIGSENSLASANVPSSEPSSIMPNLTPETTTPTSDPPIVSVAGNASQTPSVQAGNVVVQWIDKRRHRPIVVTHKRSHPCKFCGKLFPSDFSLKQHERTHTGEKPYPCTTCGRPFNNKAAMLKHKTTHDPSRYQGEPQFECDICGKKYHLKLTLYTHRRDHKEVAEPIDSEEHVCMLCPEVDGRRPSYRHLRSLLGHNKKYHSEDSKSWLPKGANMKLKAKLNPKPKKPVIKREKREGTRTVKPKPKVKKEVKLDEDGHPIPSKPKRVRKPPSNEPKRKIQLHGPRRPRGPKEPIVCSSCGKEFPNYYSLKFHTYTHTGEKPIECTVCGRRFALKGNLDKHMKSHDPNRFSGEPKHICDFCGQAFYLRVTMYHHRRRKHLGLAEKYKRTLAKRKWQLKNKRRPCECKKCGKKFDSYSKLSYHNTHQHGEKRIKCEICGRPFFDSKEKNVHLKSHDPTYLYNKLFRYQCPSCPPEKLGYPSKKAIRAHWNEVHSDQPVPDEVRIRKPREFPGEFVCKKCPGVDGKVPTYRHLRSLDKHNRFYHADNAKFKGKTWKPRDEQRVRTAAKLRNKNDHDREEESSTSEESDSESDFESWSDKEETVATERTRKSLRRTADNADFSGIVSKLIQTDQLQKPMDVPVINKMKNPKLQRKCQDRVGRKRKKNFSLSDADIRAKLGNKELRLILTRVDQATTEDKKESEKTNAKLSPPKLVFRRGQIEKVNEDLKSSKPTPVGDGVNRKIVEGIESKHAHGLQVALENSDDLVDEVKEEVESCSEDEVNEDPVAQIPPSRSLTSFPGNVPIVVHNPLSKRKDAAAIVSVHSTNQHDL